MNALSISRESIDWRETIVTAQPNAHAVIGSIASLAEFDEYSQRISSEILAARTLGDVALFDQIAEQQVTVGDVHRHKPHTTHPPTIEKRFLDSQIEKGFQLVNLRAVNLGRCIISSRLTRDGVIDEFNFAAVADLIPSQRKQPVAVAVVRADHRYWAGDIQRTLSKGVQLAATVYDLYPRSVAPGV